jgi:hypothetical protein
MVFSLPSMLFQGAGTTVLVRDLGPYHIAQHSGEQPHAFCGCFILSQSHIDHLITYSAAFSQLFFFIQEEEMVPDQ